jgi:hypothetical protein
MKIKIECTLPDIKIKSTPITILNSKKLWSSSDLNYQYIKILISKKNLKL